MSEDLTTPESIAVNYMKEEFEKNNINFSKAVRFRRRSDAYLSLIAPNDIDFCRIKTGPVSIWFSVDSWRLDSQKREDVRFSKIKNRNIRHCRLKNK